MEILNVAVRSYLSYFLSLPSNRMYLPGKLVSSSFWETGACTKIHKKPQSISQAIIASRLLKEVWMRLSFPIGDLVLTLWYLVLSNIYRVAKKVRNGQKKNIFVYLLWEHFEHRFVKVLLRGIRGELFGQQYWMPESWDQVEELFCFELIFKSLVKSGYTITLVALYVAYLWQQTNSYENYVEHTVESPFK